MLHEYPLYNFEVFQRLNKDKIKVKTKPAAFFLAALLGLETSIDEETTERTRHYTEKTKDGILMTAYKDRLEIQFKTGEIFKIWIEE